MPGGVWVGPGLQASLVQEPGIGCLFYVTPNKCLPCLCIGSPWGRGGGGGVGTWYSEKSSGLNIRSLGPKPDE